MNPDFRSRMEAFADKLLTAAETAELDVQVKAFAAVTSFLALSQATTSNPAVRPTAKRRGFQDDPPELQRKRAQRKWDQVKNPKSKAEPPGLAALREKIPRRVQPTAGEAAGNVEG
jgi:hypothetical protein